MQRWLGISTKLKQFQKDSQSYLDKIELVIQIKKSLKILTELNAQIADIGSTNQQDISARYSRKYTNIVYPTNIAV